MEIKKRVLAKVMLVILGLIAPLSMVSATPPQKFSSQAAEWWQWALSIPTSVNPMTDTSGQNCMVGQKGDTWYLAGLFGEGPVTRTCSIPESKRLFFPIINYVSINSPGVCGQGASLSVEELRAISKTYIDSVTLVMAELDGRRIRGAKREKSRVFVAALPDENIFVAPCNGDSPGGIYSPGVDDGYYIQLDRLPVGDHTLHFLAKSGSKTLQDVSYKLHVIANRR